jgi:hypothetical protein
MMDLQLHVPLRTVGATINIGGVRAMGVVAPQTAEPPALDPYDPWRHGAPVLRWAFGGVRSAGFSNHRPRQCPQLHRPDRRERGGASRDFPQSHLLEPPGARRARFEGRDLT